MWRLAFVLLIACEHGQTPPDQGIDIGPFVPQVCTGGTAGGADCPFNFVRFDAFGASGSALRFTLQLLGSGAPIGAVNVLAGTNGLHLKHPQIMVIRDGTPTPGVEYDVTLDLRPGDAATLDSAILVDTALPTLLFRFDAIEPQL